MGSHSDVAAPTITAYAERDPQVGDRARVRKTLTVAEQGFYTGICGNLHPLYVNEVHAAATPAGRRLAFELAVAALATTALAEVGGPYRRIAGIGLSFPVAAHLGDTIAAEAEITKASRTAIACRVTVRRDGDDAVVAEGTAELEDVRSTPAASGN